MRYVSQISDAGRFSALGGRRGTALGRRNAIAVFGL
jgi:hypothetical protein